MFAAIEEIRAMSCEPTTCMDPRLRSKPVEAANRETLLLLHGSAGTGALWHHTSNALRPLYRCVAPDLIGYGTSAPWPAAAPFDLDDELQALVTLLPCCGGKFHLVGYSYGGVVALHLALANPARVHSLTLIEPVFFAALSYAGERAAYDRIASVRDEFVSEMTKGNRESAMSRFVDFWSGDGAWRRLSHDMRASKLRTAKKIGLDWQASFAANPDRNGLAALGQRTMLMRGDRSAEPMRRLVDSLHTLMPGSECIVVEGANHMLPLTHESALTDAILTHLHADAERRLR
jgi:pimeloyl-ACP methyl ester carboxylesterase